MIFARVIICPRSAKIFQEGVTTFRNAQDWANE
jgi:hypothetical protein